MSTSDEPGPGAATPDSEPDSAQEPRPETGAALPLGRLDRLEGVLRALRWPALIAVVTLVAVLGYRATLRSNAATRGDTRFYQRGAQRFWEGESLYYFRPARETEPSQLLARKATAYTYLPPTAGFLGWTISIPYRVLRGLWLFAACLALWFGVGVARQLGRAPPQRPWLWVAVLALLLGRFVVNDLGHGQTNAFLALLLVLGIRDVYSERPLRGGVWIGLALVIKPTSWLLLPWLLLDRRWRALGAACAVGLGALLICWPLYGGHYLEELQDWFRLMPEFANAVSARPDNASLASSFQRLLAGSVSRGVGEPERLLGLLDLSLARPVARVAATLSVALGLGWLAWRKTRGGVSGARAAAAVLALSALLSPVTWKAHFVVLLAPVAFLAFDFASGRASRRRWVALLAAGALFLLPSRGLGALGSGLEAWGGLSLGLVLIFFLCATSPSAEEPPSLA